MKKNQEGFGLPELIICVALLVLMGAIGWKVWKHNIKPEVVTITKKTNTTTCSKDSSNPTNGNGKYVFNCGQESADFTTPIACNKIKDVSIDPKVLSLSRSDYIKSGFSPTWFDNHFKLKAVDTYYSPNDAGVDTYLNMNLIWQVCFPNNAIISRYNYTEEPSSNNVIVDFGDGKSHDITHIISASDEHIELDKCAQGKKLTDISVHIGNVPASYGQSPPYGDTEVPYIEGGFTVPEGKYAWKTTNYYVNLENGQCTTAVSGGAA